MRPLVPWICHVSSHFSHATPRMHSLLCLIVLANLFLQVLQDRVSCKQQFNWPWTLYPPASTSHVLELQTWATMPSPIHLLYFSRLNVPGLQSVLSLPPLGPLGTNLFTQEQGLCWSAQHCNCYLIWRNHPHWCGLSTREDCSNMGLSQ